MSRLITGLPRLIHSLSHSFLIAFHYAIQFPLYSNQERHVETSAAAKVAGQKL